MLILALDTSTTVSTVAVATEDRLLAEVTMQLKIPQSEVLLKHVTEALAIAHIDKTQLEAIALSIGPGSFTGLRIGLSTAKMLSYALNIPVVTTSSLMALAYHYPTPNIYIAASLDAQKGNAYYELFSWDNTIRTFKIIEPVSVVKFEQLLEHCNQLDKPVMLVGDIAQKKATIVNNYANVTLGQAHLCMPRAANVAQAVQQRLADNDYDNIMNLEPVYIRRSEAEVLWEQRHPEDKA